MKPAPFAYVAARSLEEALDRLGAHAEAKVLAGGQSLVPMMNMRLARPSTLVDINRVPGLASIEAPGPGALALGALVRQTDLLTSPRVRARAPLLAEAAAHVGHPAIRNRGTLGGSLAHADPAAELPAAAVALGATLVVAGIRGHRRIPAEEFFVGTLATALAPDEVLVRVEIPDGRWTGWGFAEVARRAGDFAIAGVAGVIRVDETSGRCADARLVALGADSRPVRLAGAERALVGAEPRAAAGAAGAAARADCQPADDVHASADYRRHLVGVLTEDVVGRAAGPRPRPAATGAHRPRPLAACSASGWS